MAATDNGSTRKHGKRKHTAKHPENGTSLNKKKCSSFAVESSVLATSNEEDLNDHTELLSSVTGQMRRLPLYKDEPCGEVAEDDCLPESDTGGDEKSNASQYLTQWHSHRKEWAFRKKTQYWLLQNMYDKKKVSIYPLSQNKSTHLPHIATIPYTSR